MAISTNVPAIAFTPTGIVLPQEADILAGVLADMQQANGGTLTVTLTSPSGQIAQSDTAIIGAKNDEIAEIVNQFDPNTADGRFQDAIGSIYFLTRKPAQGSVVIASCIGLVGATVPVGSLAQDAAGYLWASEAGATFSSAGTASISFQCQTTGPIALAPGALSVIYKAVTGWDTITNASAAVEGQNVESRADFEFRRRNSVAANAKGSTAAILGSVLSLPNVLDAYVIDNPTNAAVTVGATNYSVAANSVYIAVVGGAATDIANAIWVKKDLGCSYNGNTSAVVTDTANAGNPEYTVTWETPAALPIYFLVNLAANAALPSNIIALAQQAVLDAFNGADGGERARISDTIYSGRFYAGLYALNANVNVLSLYVGSATVPSTTAQPIGIDQVPTLAIGNIAVTLT
jgi:hypothetical protein